jgi:hypothetical protein
MSASLQLGEWSVSEQELLSDASWIEDEESRGTARPYVPQREHGGRHREEGGRPGSADLLGRGGRSPQAVTTGAVVPGRRPNGPGGEEPAVLLRWTPTDTYGVESSRG